MKHARAYFPYFICLLAIFSAILVYAVYLESPRSYREVQSPADLVTLQITLAEQELALATSREELSALLTAFYQGQASEQETQALVERVEAERQQVEELQRQLTGLLEQIPQ